MLSFSGSDLLTDTVGHSSESVLVTYLRHGTLNIARNRTPARRLSCEHVRLLPEALQPTISTVVAKQNLEQLILSWLAMPTAPLKASSITSESVG